MGLFGKSTERAIQDLQNEIDALHKELVWAGGEIERLRGQLNEQGKVLFDIEVALGIKKRARTISGTAVQTA